MHAGARLGSQWQRRKPCVQGPVRRAHPASGATWNVQVVRGKVNTRCLWHACRALSLGLLLMLLGAAMATIGYYADQLSIGQEIRGNATVRVKNESRGFHLNNLSYAGPIVMGVGANRPDIVLVDHSKNTTYIVDVTIPHDENLQKAERDKILKYMDLAHEIKDMWRTPATIVVPIVISTNGLIPKSLHANLCKVGVDGGLKYLMQKAVLLSTCRTLRFIVVAACVMTFEARDSAAKVVPARFKMTPAKVRQVPTATRRSAGSQTGRWEQHLGVFKSSPTPSDRRALTAALMQFSKNLGSVEHRPSQTSISSRSPQSPSRSPRQNLARSGSVPDMRAGADNRNHTVSHSHKSPKREAPRRPRPTLLNPAMLQRQALSVDDSRVRCARYSHESLAGSQGSMAMDLHIPCEGAVTLRVRDRSRTSSRTSRTGSRPPNTRSDTARRHMLARQRPIDDDENHGHNVDRSHSPRSQRTYGRFSRDNSLSIGYDNRRSSNASDSVHHRRRHREVRQIIIRRSASTSPQPRRVYKKPPPSSFDLGASSHPVGEDNSNMSCVSPDMATSEYHTVCEDHVISMPSESRSSPLRFAHSTESRDSRYSTETGTLHTAAEITTSNDSAAESDCQVGTPTSSQTENDADYDLTEDITPTILSDVTSSKNDDNDASTVIDVACVGADDPVDSKPQENV